jgi:diguanylate cyclase (GGDEF)-like protein
MYDIDYFKHVNDTFGHDVGDSVLQALTALVRKTVRTSDVVARWGGEEFLVLMPQSDLSGAKSMAEKLRQTVAQYHFEKAGGITASFGVTTLVPQDDSNSLLKRVDDALYLAKQRGRDRVETLIAETSGVGIKA